jgi:FAD/FMN-containing dehydrogenase
MALKDDVLEFFNGDVEDSGEALKKYSHDASLLEVVPELIVFPRNSKDIQALVKFAASRKKDGSKISLTARAAGTCMAGGSLNESIIIDTQRYMSGVISVDGHTAKVLPGTFYRDFEKRTLAKGLIMPSYTASKSICAIGGMVMNNAGGEKTLAYGKTENYVREMKIVFSDGNEYTIKSLTKEGLKTKVAEKTAEGKIYKEISKLIKDHEDIISNAKPNVSKNSAGYFLWNVWREDGKFDLNKLLVGSQGTLGILTEVTFDLVKVKKYSKLLVVFLKDLKNIPAVVNAALPYKPESIESYDDHTFKMAMKFLPGLIKQMKVKNFLRFALSFWPEVKMTLTSGIPKLVVLIEFASDSEKDIDSRMNKLKDELDILEVSNRVSKTEQESEKYWTMRRESFSLLRKHVSGRRTAPFIDDFVVRPEFLPDFMPELDDILSKYDLIYTIAGHVGDGNFHIIPLMDMHDKRNKEIITELSHKVYDLVLKYEGSITAEHNDGIIRTPFLEKMYGKDVIDLFQKTKDIFDPLNILNPGKKVGGTFEYIYDHIAEEA